jgi:DNA-binding NtrC family response regulator
LARRTAVIFARRENKEAMVERVLIVDDDPVQRRLLEAVAIRAGYAAVTADGGEAALKAMLAPDGPAIDCVVLDLVMPDLDGLAVLARMRDAGVAIPVIVQTAHGGIDTAVTAMRAGAVDFAVKPVGAERLMVSLRNAMAAHALAGEITRLKRSRAGTLTFRDIVTRSDKMRSVLRTAEKTANSTIPVLIEGESGVGKELIARAIHGSGERRAKPFVAVNCGALPENLVESILFGHEKGAFTGATERHEGKFLEASGGTLFLDEIGELPPAAQVKLLRAVQDGKVEPVGGKKPVNINVRIVSATNRNLLQDVQSGRFREDLFYRLHVFPITVPPLRDRIEDIPELTRHFLARFAAEEGKRIRSISGDTLRVLAAYRWPGNVRQLENAIFRAVVLAETSDLTLAEFPQIAAHVVKHYGCAALPPNGPPAPPVGPVEPFALPAIDAPLVLDEAIQSAALANAGLTSAGITNTGMVNAAAADGTLSLLDGAGEMRPLDDIEADAIRFALAHYGGQMSEVARRLRIGRSTLYRKLDVIGLTVAEHDRV